MNKEKIINESTLIIEKVLEENIIGKIKLDDNLFKYGLNSVKIIRLIVELEEYFDFKFEDDDLMIEQFNSIEKIVNNIRIKLNVMK